jgi:hypothetical protein
MLYPYMLTYFVITALTPHISIYPLISLLTFMIHHSISCTDPIELYWLTNVKQLFHLFIHQWFYSPLLGPGLFFNVVIIFTQTVGLLGRGISLSQGRYLHTGQYKHRINAHTDIHALSEFRKHDPSVRESEDSSCLRPHCHCDQQNYVTQL